MRCVATLGVARESVVRDRLPWRCVGNELAHAWANPGIAVERPHANANRIGVGGIVAKQRRAAVATEPFLAAARRPPHTESVLAGDDTKGAGRGVGIS